MPRPTDWPTNQLYFNLCCFVSCTFIYSSFCSQASINSLFLNNKHTALYLIFFWKLLHYEWWLLGQMFMNLWGIFIPIWFWLSLVKNRRENFTNWMNSDSKRHHLFYTVFSITESKTQGCFTLSIYLMSWKTCNNIFRVVSSKKEIYFLHSVLPHAIVFDSLIQLNHPINKPLFATIYWNDNLLY